jgi:hypothetical protein
MNRSRERALEIIDVYLKVSNKCVRFILLLEVYMKQIRTLVDIYLHHISIALHIYLLSTLCHSTIYYLKK